MTVQMGLYSGEELIYKLDRQEEHLIFMVPNKDTRTAKIQIDPQQLEFDCVSIKSIGSLIQNALERFMPKVKTYFQEEDTSNGVFELDVSDLREGPLEISLLFFEEIKSEETEQMKLSGCVSYCNSGRDGFSILEFTIDLINSSVEFLDAEFEELAEKLKPLIEGIATDFLDMVTRGF